MSDFDQIELRTLDFALLLLFREILRGGKLTRAAQALGLTPSAASHGLSRLRRIFGDELFVRRPHGLAPTEFARRLGPQIEAVLIHAQAVLAQGRAFAIADVRRDVAIVASDLTLSFLAAPLLARTRRDAPGLRLAFRSPTPDGAGRALREGTVDLQIGPPVLGERVERRKLYLENYQVVGRRLPSARLTLEDYVAADHLLVTMDGSFHGVVDIALGAMGLERRVVASAPNFLAALAIVAESDVLLTAPTRLARTHAGRFGLARLPPPLEVGGYEVAISRARRERPDPCLDWLCEAIAQIACGAPPLPS